MPRLPQSFDLRRHCNTLHVRLCHCGLCIRIGIVKQTPMEQSLRAYNQWSAELQLQHCVPFTCTLVVP